MEILIGLTNENTHKHYLGQMGSISAHAVASIPMKIKQNNVFVSKDSIKQMVSHHCLSENIIKPMVFKHF